jgi:hypothetical protein
VVVSTSKLNSNGVLTFDKIFIKIILKESILCKCCNNEAPISCYAKGVSFEDKISNVSFKSLSPKGFLVQVLFQGLGVGSSVHYTDVHFPGAEDGKCVATTVPRSNSLTPIGWFSVLIHPLVGGLLHPLDAPNSDVPPYP